MTRKTCFGQDARIAFVCLGWILGAWPFFVTRANWTKNSTAHWNRLKYQMQSLYNRNPRKCCPSYFVFIGPIAIWSLIYLRCHFYIKMRIGTQSSKPVLGASNIDSFLLEIGQHCKELSLNSKVQNFRQKHGQILPLSKYIFWQSIEKALLTVFWLMALALYHKNGTP